ncbi:MAG: UdgX family uracil-DNA binding protein [Methylotenera sp.]|nr:UdgX family uracil-DNA binding protein [Oligoflexia bacterium]
MRTVFVEPTFESWRLQARRLLQEGAVPAEVFFQTEGTEQNFFPGLFENVTTPASLDSSASTLPKLRVPADFIALAETVADHRDERKWDLLYRVLWRITHGEPHLLSMAIDSDMRELLTMEKGVRFDSHKMKAFVRFKKIEVQAGSGITDHYVAWHCPDHPIVRRVAPFFERRFRSMNWTILTPDHSVTWNGQELVYGPGVPISQAPKADDLEALWLTYYKSTFNPARIKLKTMTKEMPTRHWRTLPETRAIQDLLRESPERLLKMFQDQPRSASEFFPKLPEGEKATLEDLRKAAAGCRACGICEKATQTIFGEGPPDAQIVLVGEQPGDQEDLEGRPFIGPAGELLNRALRDAGLNRPGLYLTNAVKHFKWTPPSDPELTSRKRIHQRPSASEIAICKPWLSAELSLLRPKVLICLGVTAGQSVLGKTVKLGEERGRFHETAWTAHTFLTTHPSAILRMMDPDLKKAEYARFVSELKTATSVLQSPSPQISA